MGIFAAIAALLAAVGLYGVLSSVVRQRTSEIGIRMAFGSQNSGIFSLIIGHGLRLSALGIVIGVAVALAATRVMGSMLVSVAPTDPFTYIAMIGVFLAVATLACWVPARRAASLDPNVALRQE
jgi:putative ABC transport system permease protein